MVPAIICISVVVLLVLWYVATYNSFIKIKEMVDESFSGMDVCLKKRHDLIPNLVSTVKGYAAHEEETLEAVVSARNVAANNSGDISQAIANEKGLTQALSKLMAIVENYPDLKANANFLDLQEKLSYIEEEIARSRQYYNGTTRKYNTKVKMIPQNIVAQISGFKEIDYYEIDDVAERENVKVEF